MTDETKPQDSAAMPPASAGSHGDRCRCILRTRLVGDGCEHCNPAMMIDILREQIAEMRLTDEERDDITIWLAECLRQYSATQGLENGDVAERWRHRALRAGHMLKRLK